MGRKSTKENKTIYQQYRERENLTRESAADLLDSISADRIERIENERIIPAPEDVIRMSECYKAPELCNYYCSHQCPIGEKYVPEVELGELPNIILETVASLNSMYPLTNRLIEISRDGRISDDEIPDFARIQRNLEQVSLAVDALHLWVERTISENKINKELLDESRENLQ
ncbi:MAG: helix-turn-helix transcriptional regulator [Lachnospiraceae bacterium]|nr:helix-turn-helix domain-containing protein [Agathobacter sp.]MDD6292145.1 helix-turn-helix transcriptional regulator [Lachnospiraceae bacterium]